MNKFGLTEKEFRIFKKLDTPIKIQEYLDKFPINWEKGGETCLSPRKVLQENKMHCLEGALLAAAALWVNGEKPLLLDLQADGGDVDHVVTLYKRNGYWGAISKTNHAVLRFRDPVYKTLRELSLSYFHEYFYNKTRKKTLKRFSTKPFDLRKLSYKWITSEDDLFFISDEIDKAPHQSLVPSKNKNLLKKADRMELSAGKIIKWKRNDPRT